MWYLRPVMLWLVSSGECYHLVSYPKIPNAVLMLEEIKQIKVKSYATAQ